MTCNYCGFENADDASKCIKCGALLEGPAFKPQTPPVQSSFGKTISDKESPPAFDDRQRTFEKAANETAKTPNNQVLNEIEKDILRPCENCGFPNPVDATVCANCGKAVEQEAQNEVPEAETEMPAAKPSDTVPGYVHDPNRKFSSTIDPYRYKEPKSRSFFFTPVEREKEKETSGEKADLTTKEFSFEDEPVALNRSNLDGNNFTITGKVQAEIFQKGGKWYIVDRSELETTFVRAGNFTEIKDGDLILMGDRKFIFSTKRFDPTITGGPNADE